MYALNRDDDHPGARRAADQPSLTHVLPPTILGSEKADPYPRNVAKAKQLLKAAGYVAA